MVALSAEYTYISSLQWFDTTLVGRQEGHPACKNTVCWFVGGDYSDWSFARLVAPVLTTTAFTLSSDKIKNGDILVPANRGPPGKWPLKRRDTCSMQPSDFVNGQELTTCNTL